MNGIENISARILDEAKEKAAQILKDADDSAARIEAEGREKTDAEVAIVAKAGKARVTDIEEKARLNAGSEVRKIIAGKKQELIEKAFADALEQLLGLPADKYQALLADLAVQASQGGGKGELLLGAADVKYGAAVLEAANKKLGEGTLTLATDTADIRGGVVIRRGKIEINCALEVMVRMLQEEISGEVAACLFDKGA